VGLAHIPFVPAGLNTTARNKQRKDDRIRH
jgi:hypothetical protein